MGKQRKGEPAGEAGFTLIEIVMVLVLLGILAAVAVPKFFDLQEEAERNAAMVAVAEAQARINAKFAEEVLSGKTCLEALATVRNLNEVADSAAAGSSGSVFGEFILYPGTLSSEVDTNLMNAQRVGSDREFEEVGSLVLPSCVTDISLKTKADTMALSFSILTTPSLQYWDELRTLPSETQLLSSSEKGQAVEQRIRTTEGRSISSDWMFMKQSDGTVELLVVDEGGKNGILVSWNPVAQGALQEKRVQVSFDGERYSVW